MPPRPIRFDDDLGVLGLPGDVNPWDIRFDPVTRRHLDVLDDGSARFTVWAEPELSEAWLVIRDPSGGATAYRMEVSGESRRFVFYRLDLLLPGPVDYSFAFRTTTGRPVYFSPTGVTGSIERFERFHFDPATRRAADVPEWARGAVIYQIFPDRFANGDPSNDPPDVRPWSEAPQARAFQGGDLDGITGKLDYLHGLGVDALYLNPIFASPSNHRYDAVDYRNVDPILGGNAALERLVTAAHQRDIKVILDASFNHCHPRFFAFADLIERGPRSPYRGWFVVNEWPLRIRVRPGRGHWSSRWIPVWAEQSGIPVEEVTTPGPPVEPTYEAWYSVPTMPRVNLANPEAREYMLETATHWIAEFGVDGWRMDVARYVDPNFWNDFRARVREAMSDAYLVSEIFGDVSSWLEGDRFDATMNYTFRSLCLAFLARGEIDARTFADRATALYHQYGADTTLVNLSLIGSHDTPRFLTEAGGEEWRLRLATVFQLTFPGAPGLYYGDEVGLEGGDDPGCRRTFPWGDEVADRAGLVETVSSLTRLRRKLPALRIGGFRVLGVEGSTVVFERRHRGSRVVVAINAGSRRSRVPIVVKQIVWGDGSVGSDGIDVPARAAAIFR